MNGNGRKAAHFVKWKNEMEISFRNANKTRRFGGTGARGQKGALPRCERASRTKWKNFARCSLNSGPFSVTCFARSLSNRLT